MLTFSLSYGMERTFVWHPFDVRGVVLLVVRSNKMIGPGFDGSTNCRES